MPQSKLSLQFGFYVSLKQIPRAIPEYKFDAVRKWRFDFAYPEYKLGIELDGGVFTQGRHTRGVGFINDCEKLNAATMQGWRVLRYTQNTLSNAIPQINAIIELLDKKLI
jgi:very-short-patch-repair endonuclease